MNPRDETLLDLSLSRSTVDRDARARAAPETLPLALQDPTTLVLELRGATAAVFATPPARLALRPPEASDGDGVLFFLGRRDGRFYLARVLPQPRATDVDSPRSGPEQPGVPPGTADVSWQSLRDVGAALDDTEAGLFTTATALAQWHARNQHCPRCGSTTEVALGGWVRRCRADGSEHYPRTDPAVIMAVTDADDRLLLATGLPWPQGRVSVLAGFVEAGESLEAAVVREVAEEVGLEVTDLHYRGNQPWPFPASLMLGYTARATGVDLQLDPAELTSAGWYTRQELAEKVAAGQLTLPSRVSIARRLIEEWFGGPLEDGP